MICRRRSSQSFSWDLNSIQRSPFSLISFQFSLSTHWARCVRISKCWVSVFSLCLKSSVDSPAFFCSSSIYFDVSFNFSSRIEQISLQWLFKWVAVSLWMLFRLPMMSLKVPSISFCHDCVRGSAAVEGMPAPTISCPTVSPSMLNGLVDFYLMVSPMSWIVCLYSCSRAMYLSCFLARLSKSSHYIQSCSSAQAFISLYICSQSFYFLLSLWPFGLYWSFGLWNNSPCVKILLVLMGISFSNPGVDR